MIYLFYGSLAILLWKCGAQLLKEMSYKGLKEEEAAKKKIQHNKTSKYEKVYYN